MTPNNKTRRAVSPRWTLASTTAEGYGTTHVRGIDYPAAFTATLTLEQAHAVARYELDDKGVRCASVELHGAVAPDALARLATDVQTLAVPVARSLGLSLRDGVPDEYGLAPASTELRRQLIGTETADEHELRLVAIAYTDPEVLERPRNRRNRVERVRLTLGYGSGDAAEAGKMTAFRRVAAARLAGLIPDKAASDDELSAAWSRLTGWDRLAESPSQ